MSSPIVQYIAVRKDLLTHLKWPLGALMAQACHASSAVLHLHAHDGHVAAYLADLDNMHKVVLACNDEQCLVALHRTLCDADVAHKLWREQPEDIVTCLAVKPAPKAELQRYFKGFKLFS